MTEAHDEAHDEAGHEADEALTEVERQILKACLPGPRNTIDLLKAVGYETRTGIDAQLTSGWARSVGLT